MQTIQKAFSVTAGAKSANIMEGELGRFLVSGQPFRVSAKASATGALLTVIANTPVVNDQAFTFNATNQFPIIPDDVMGTYRSPGAAELQIFVRNPTAGTITGIVRVDIA